MKNKAPRSRRNFAGRWDEIGYLYDKLLYWLYERGDVRRASAFSERLARLLHKVAPDHEAIFAEECWSLIWEARGDFRRAIKYRQSEIRLIERLHRLAIGTPQQDIVLNRYGYADLSDRLDLLAILYHDSGNPSKAIAVLRESERLCKKHSIPFDGQDVLDEYLAESQELVKTG